MISPNTKVKIRLKDIVALHSAGFLYGTSIFYLVDGVFVWSAIYFACALLLSCGIYYAIYKQCKIGSCAGTSRGDLPDTTITE